MSDRPDEQALEPPISKMVDGIDELGLTFDARNSSGDWSVEHKDELAALKVDLVKMRFRLTRLRRETW